MNSSRIAYGRSELASSLSALFTERHSCQFHLQTFLLSSARRLSQSLGNLEEFSFLTVFDEDFFWLSHDFSFAHRTYVWVIINT